MPGRESAGFLHDDAPYLKIGQGPPLVMVPGLTPEHDAPRGWQRQLALASARPLARDFTVYVVNRKRGLQPGESRASRTGGCIFSLAGDTYGRAAPPRPPTSPLASCSRACPSRPGTDPRRSGNARQPCRIQ
jgi:hypothetical protein